MLQRNLVIALQKMAVSFKDLISGFPAIDRQISCSFRRYNLNVENGVNNFRLTQSSAKSSAPLNAQSIKLAGIHGKEFKDASSSMQIGVRKFEAKAPPQSLKNKVAAKATTAEAASASQSGSIAINRGITNSFAMQFESFDAAPDMGGAAVRSSIVQAEMDDQLMDMRQQFATDLASKETNEIVMLTDAGIQQSISEEDAFLELQEVKKKCLAISRMTGQKQLEHCLALLRSMSELMTDEAKTFVHGWGCYILSHF